jgi:signal peptidase I
MAPTLLPGDYLLVDRAAYATRSPWPGEVVFARDPREPVRTLVKRVTAIEGDGALLVAGDNASATTDSRTFGAISPAGLLGRAVFRYWPPSRVGRIR